MKNKMNVENIVELLINLYAEQNNVEVKTTKKVH
jgi:hypothetical protein